jgi:hypothetical protein
LSGMRAACPRPSLLASSEPIATRLPGIYANGHSLASIGDQLGVSPTTIGKALTWIIHVGWHDCGVVYAKSASAQG